MLELNLNPITGELNLDGLSLEIDSEEGFCNCDFYHKSIKHKAIKTLCLITIILTQQYFSKKNFKLLYVQYVLVFLLWFILSIKIVNIINP